MEPVHVCKFDKRAGIALRINILNALVFTISY